MISDPDTKALEARLREIVGSSCSHDMGFDRELGPMGCDLEFEGKGGCFCAGMVPIMREAADTIAALHRENSELRAADRDHLAAKQGMEARLTARAEAAEAEASTLRQILSECASAIGNGAFAEPRCSLEFLAHIPEEIRLHFATLQKKLERAESTSPSD